MSTPTPLPGFLSGWPSQVYFFFRFRAVRYVLSWFLAVGVGAFVLHHCWHLHDRPQRRDGNRGHVLIDFGGQWLHARMLVEGFGRQLYHSEPQNNILDQNYLVADQSPDKDGPSDADQLKKWLVTADPEEGQKYQIRGPLYPPLHAFYYAPIGMLSPHRGYRTFQITLLVAVLLTAFGINRLSRGRIWTPLAFSLLLAFPGCTGALILGQNSPISLMFFTWGWVALSRKMPILAGFLWALLAFKPVWAVVLCLVPLLTLRWKMLFSMVITGILLILVTLPVTGVQTWLDWVRVGRTASRTYDVDYNWIQLSRDCLGLSRRWMIEFHEPVPMVRRVGVLLKDLSWEANPNFHSYPDDWETAEKNLSKSGSGGEPIPMIGRVGTFLVNVSMDGDPESPHHRNKWDSFEGNLNWSRRTRTPAEKGKDPLGHTMIGLMILGFILEVTVRRCLLHRRMHQYLHGWPVTFLMLGALFCCYHYIYYDEMLAALPVALLALYPAQYFVPAFWRRSSDPLPDETVDYYRPRLPTRYPLTQKQPRTLWTRNSFVIALVAWICASYHWSWVWWGGPPNVLIPWEQYGLLVLWGWSCIAWTRDASLTTEGTRDGDHAER